MKRPHTKDYAFCVAEIRTLLIQLRNKEKKPSTGFHFNFTVDLQRLSEPNKIMKTSANRATSVPVEVQEHHDSGNPERMKRDGKVLTWETVSYTHLDVYKRQRLRWK